MEAYTGNLQAIGEHIEAQDKRVEQLEAELRGTTRSTGPAHYTTKGSRSVADLEDELRRKDVAIAQLQRR
eukprot:scaffold362799_cov53-Prasinocladus_malaysianus.AAC.1